MKSLQETKATMIRVKWILLTAFFTLQMTMLTFAADNYAENGVRWLLDQAFWVVLGITVCITIGALLKHATSVIIITVIVGGFVAFLCKNPEVISTAGENIGRIVTGG